MYQRAPTVEFTVHEYLAFEEASETKHEYYDGKIYDMAGGSPDHNLISVNIGAALSEALRKTPCRVFSSDMRVLIEALDLYTYPDVSVVCGKLEYDRRSKTTITNPLILVEVLSPSTRTYDRGDKVAFYKRIPSLQEILLVEAERPHVQILRHSARRWTARDIIGLDATVALHAAPCEISLRQIYDKATWLS
ncbi:MAG: Uma2 family endonuclease [Chloroflexi bacterium]|nr:Uma2 family endonuclease [Chloroflexota bacterium]